jgi:hypothetical protein
MMKWWPCCRRQKVIVKAKVAVQEKRMPRIRMPAGPQPKRMPGEPAAHDKCECKGCLLKRVQSASLPLPVLKGSVAKMMAAEAK